MKLIITALFFALSAQAQIPDTNATLENHATTIDVPLTLKVSTNGKILSMDELKAYFVNAGRVLGTPGNRNMIYGSLRTAGVNGVRILNNGKVATGFSVALVSASLTYVEQINQDTFFHVRYTLDVNAPFNMLGNQDVLFDVAAYDEFKSKHCSDCSSDKAIYNSGVTAPNMSMEVGVNYKGYKIKVDGRTTSFARTVKSENNHLDPADRIWANLRGNQQTVGIELAKDMNFNNGFRFELFGRAEMNYLKLNNSMTFHPNVDNFKNLKKVEVDLPTSHSKNPYVGVGARFYFKLKNTGVN